jgi:eukaryotic-like serine/threonine-protein kinase
MSGSDVDADLSSTPACNPRELAEVEAFARVGSTLGGKYRIERVLGVGGMGAVVSAVHLALGERVAIKFLLPNALGKDRRCARLVREARAVSRMRSRHVARVHDVDVRDDGTPYIVMEHLEGETLAACLKREGALSFERIADTALEMCEAVAEAHSLGVVHRDIKPANIFLARGAGNVVSVKVLDFGISKVETSTSEDQLTTGDGFLGSPPYMSPEQLTQPTLVDHRTDIWSIGVTLYGCVTGKTAFKADTTAQVCALVLTHRPDPVEHVRVDTPPSLARAIERCMQKDRTQRFGSVLELARTLAGNASDRGKRALAVTEAIGAAAPDDVEATSGAAVTSALDAGTLSAAAETKGAVSPRTAERSLAAALLVILVISLVGAAWLAIRRIANGAAQGPAASGAPLAAPPTVATVLTTSRAEVPFATSSAAPAVGARAPARVGSAAVKTVPRHPRASASAAKPLPDKPKRDFDPVFDERR